MSMECNFKYQMTSFVPSWRCQSTKGNSFRGLLSNTYVL